MLNCLE